MNQFTTVFVSIVLEALPFILLGSIASAFIQVYISTHFIENIIPKHKWLGFLTAGLIGLIVPICECAIIPITRRFIKKGAPIGMAITFMLAAPLINSIVLLSTYYAFDNKMPMVYARGVLGFVAAITIGVLIGQQHHTKETVLKMQQLDDRAMCLCGCRPIDIKRGNVNKITSLLEHTSSEFIDISRYLIFGALLAAFFQAYINKSDISQITAKPYLAVLFMMALAFILSLCSEVDAFVASTFLGQFEAGSILAFLIFGPMLDLKNTFMLVGNFKRNFVLKLSLYIILVSCLIGLIGNLLM